MPEAGAEDPRAAFLAWAERKMGELGRRFDPEDPTLEAAATMYKRAVLCERELGEGAPFIMTERGAYKRHPCSGEAMERWKEFRYLLGELGLTPDRTMPAGDEDEDPLDSLLHSDGRQRVKVV